MLPAMHQFMCCGTQHIHEMTPGQVYMQLVSVRLVHAKTLLVHCPVVIAVQHHLGHAFDAQFLHSVVNKCLNCFFVLISFVEKHLCAGGHAIFRTVGLTLVTFAHAFPATVATATFACFTTKTKSWCVVAAVAPAKL